MFVSFDTKIQNKKMFNEIKDKKMFNDYLELGRTIFIQNQKSIYDTLDKYLLDDGVIDGDAISQDWFPIIKADVFISHSHLDEDYVIAFAGWLEDKFKLNAFVDSWVWGYSNNLLKNIDNKYCKNSKNTYNYKKRNISTSHVHMMLNVALMKMMDRCECIFFMNTPNALPIADYIKNTESTLSPWIYSEIEMTKYLREQIPPRIGRLHPATEMVQHEHAGLNIQYKVNKTHMKKINDQILKEWSSECSNNEHPLDTLYKKVHKIEKIQHRK